MYTSFLSWSATGSVVVKLADDMEGGHEADEADAHHKYDGGRDLEPGRIVRVETQHVAVVPSAEPSSSSAPWRRCPPPPQTRRSRPLGRRPSRVRSRHPSPSACPARPRRRRRRLALRSLRHRCKLPQPNTHTPMRDAKSSRNKTLELPCELPVLFVAFLSFLPSFGVACQSRKSRVEKREREEKRQPSRMVGLPVWMDKLDIHPTYSSNPPSRDPPTRFLHVLHSVSFHPSNYLLSEREKVFLTPSDVTRRMRTCHVASRVAFSVRTQEWNHLHFLVMLFLVS